MNYKSEEQRLNVIYRPARTGTGRTETTPKEWSRMLAQTSIRMACVRFEGKRSVCVTTAWAQRVREGSASAVFGRTRMRSLHTVVASSGGKLLTECNYMVNYVAIKITRVWSFPVHAVLPCLLLGWGARGIVSIDGGEQLASRPGRSAPMWASESTWTLWQKFLAEA